MVIDRVAATFGLGRSVSEPVAVPGGLSNDVWRVPTELGVFAVKRMVANADRPGFAERVEAAFRIERTAWSVGVPMPEPVPVPATGHALAAVDGAWFRVHRWVDGEAGAGTPAEAAALLATIHVAGASRTERLPDGADARWFRELPPPPSPLVVVDSHRDLDRKNALRGADGVLRALDWDAAGPVSAVQEAIALAVDWSDAEPEPFAAAVEAYRRAGGTAIPAESWVFAGWVEAQSGWLELNLTRRAGTPLGDSESAATLARLRTVDANLDGLLGILAR